MESYDSLMAKPSRGGAEASNPRKVYIIFNGKFCF